MNLLLMPLAGKMMQLYDEEVDYQLKNTFGCVDGYQVPSIDEPLEVA
jgi:hypothetical protein